MPEQTVVIPSSAGCSAGSHGVLRTCDTLILRHTILSQGWTLHHYSWAGTDMASQEVLPGMKLDDDIRMHQSVFNVSRPDYAHYNTCIISLPSTNSVLGQLAGPMSPIHALSKSLHLRFIKWCNSKTSQLFCSPYHSILLTSGPDVSPSSDVS
jgi:hypothetical protein